MTIDDMNRAMLGFQQRCYAIIEVKNLDYHPERVPMLGVFRTACETGVRPVQVLWGMMHKQISAVRSYVVHRQLASETLASRLADVANYAALIEFLEANYTELVWTAYEYLHQQTTCDERVWCNPEEPACERCRLLAWLRTETGKWPSV